MNRSDNSGKKYVGAVDQGTTSTRFVIFDRQGRIAAWHQIEHRQIYPRPGWVEHDPLEIRDKTYEAIAGAMQKGGIRPGELAAIGVTNQRETTVVWDPATGRPYANALVWQDTRTDEICRNLSQGQGLDRFRRRVGLPLATYFSGPKIKWLLDHVPGLKEEASKGKAVFGNIDSWLIWWLTGGPGGRHVTDVSNASRTMLLNLETLDWDEEMLAVFGLPRSMLPAVKSSSEIYGYTPEDGIFGARIPVSGDLGDQQAALFGQACFEVGQAKNTYGTGCFLLLNTGEKPVLSSSGLLTTVAYQIGSRPAVYALEGAVAIAGSLVQWFRDNFGLVKNSADIESLAGSVPDNGGLYFVPAFSGLFAPHWRSDARGLIIGLTHYINKGHLARAILEATAFQTKEVFEAMEKDSGLKLSGLKVDGGMVVNELLMQFQADLLGVPVRRPRVVETTVLGAACAAGLAVGFWSSPEELQAACAVDREWRPNMPDGERTRLYKSWRKAVDRACGWLET
ncbi:MAG: glycerol kinase GlpK [Thermodesulfobacteriota bacterium]